MTIHDLLATKFPEPSALAKHILASSKDPVARAAVSGNPDERRQATIKLAARMHGIRLE